LGATQNTNSPLNRHRHSNSSYSEENEKNISNLTLSQLTLLQNSGKKPHQIVAFGFGNSALAYETVQRQKILKNYGEITTATVTEKK